MTHHVLDGSQHDAATQRKPGVGWIVLGFLGGWFGYLALTGAACGEAWLAAIAGALAGGVWRAIAIRRQLRRNVTFLGGIVLITVCTLAIGAVRRALAPATIFQNAFGTEPPASIQFVKSRRFGYMDNTSLVVMKTDKATLEEPLKTSDFKVFEDAAQWLEPPSDASMRLADHERHFRLTASIGGVFREELPFHYDLVVYQRRIEHSSGGPKRSIAVTWDPKTSLAYVFVTDY